MITEINPPAILPAGETLMHSVARLSLLVVISLLAASPLYACPFCSAPSLTLTEQLRQSQVAATAVWVSAIEPDGKNVASTTLKVRDVLNGSGVTPGEEVTIDSYRTGEPGDLFLILANTPDAASEATPTFINEGADGDGLNIAPVVDADALVGQNGLQWSTPIDISEAAAGYLAELPQPGTPEGARLLFFMNYLENPDDTVSNDAYAEFASSPYEIIVPLADKMPRERIRQWVVSDKTSPTRLGLYGLLLGLCGDESDIAVMEAKITEQTDDFRLGIDGVMGGYLLLAGEEGLKLIEETKLKDKTIPFSETYAAMQALRFLWTDAIKTEGETRFTKDRLRQAMRTLLERTELADLVIADLARWSDWSQMDQIYALYDAEGYDVPSIKRAVVRFYLAATRVKENPPTDAQKEQAEEYLAELRDRDPKTVKAAERFFFLN